MFAWKTSLTEALQNAEKRIAALEARCDTLERDHKNALLDYNDLYDKTLRLHGRITKRAKLDSERVEAPPEGNGEDMVAKARQALIERKLRRS